MSFHHPIGDLLEGLSGASERSKLYIHMKEALIFDTDDAAARALMEEEVRTIEALPAVRELLQLDASKSKEAGFQAMLWCYAGRECGGCGKRHEPPVFLTGSRTTRLGCLQELRKRLVERHSGCVAAAEAARAAEAKAQQSTCSRINLLD